MGCLQGPWIAGWGEGKRGVLGREPFPLGHWLPLLLLGRLSESRSLRAQEVMTRSEAIPSCPSSSGRLAATGCPWPSLVPLPRRQRHWAQLSLSEVTSVLSAASGNSGVNKSGFIAGDPLCSLEEDRKRGAL